MSRAKICQPSALFGLFDTMLIDEQQLWFHEFFQTAWVRHTQVQTKGCCRLLGGILDSVCDINNLSVLDKLGVHLLCLPRKHDSRLSFYLDTCLAMATVQLHCRIRHWNIRITALPLAFVHGLKFQEMKISWIVNMYWKLVQLAVIHKFTGHYKPNTKELVLTVFNWLSLGFSISPLLDQPVTCRSIPFVLGFARESALHSDS